jgi:trans-aconitate 2-methyltransferase
MSTRDWDAATYDRISAPQRQWAAEQLDRLDLRGDEVVLDAGCGSGAITELLADRVPEGRVYGVDLAPSMTAHAAQTLGDRATILTQDLAELDLPEPVDVIFSNATFHWVPDHDALFAALARNLRPGGRLIAQCGGKGNIDSFRRVGESLTQESPYAEYFAGWTQPWNYATAEETAERLDRAGFTGIETWLEPRPTTPPEPRAFAETVCLVRHLDLLPEELGARFVDEVLARMGDPLVLDYVRLNMVAQRVAP